MSIGTLSISEHAVAGQASCVASSTSKLARKRQIVAKADSVAQPEPR